MLKNSIKDADLTDFNTLQLSSLGRVFVELYNVEELAAIFDYAKSHELTILPLGEGSNVVLPKYVHALVLQIKTRGISVVKESAEHIYVKVHAGENWHDFVMSCVQKGWHGLENLALIPGSVGAAPIQNIGAYGVEIAQFIESVSYIELSQSTVLDQISINEQYLNNKNCQFDYRESIFKQSLRDKVLITSVVFKLKKSFEPVIDYPVLKAYLAQHSDLSTLTAEQVANAVIAIRQTKLPDPEVLANAGSFFKNVLLEQKAFDTFCHQHPEAPWFEQGGNYKVPAAWLIEQCGFKGARSGNLGMHDKQALVMVHYSKGRATANDVLSFAKEISQAVFNRFAIQLEIEPRCIKGQNSS